MAEGWTDAQLSCDDFLGGQLKILQPLRGYRAGIDPVLLAASIPAGAGDCVLELGCGAGVAALCLGRRVPGVALTGLEVQPDYAALAHRNAVDNRIDFTILTGDLNDMPDELRQRQYSHVIANPPYFDRRSSTAAQDAGRETALGGETPLADWVKAAARRVAPKGYVTMIQRADRLPELLAAFSERLGSLEALPLIPRRGRSAPLVLLRGRKSGRAAFRLHDGWKLHKGKTHKHDGENYTKATACVLRNGSALPFPA
ncbi:N5-glutamine S-adenosyl-L-methionine-dependent methyltransferase [Roseovarius litorisediminis]|uniref:N5-glutamine S-adenosyl-L-methionine-dependent methyltransferase n=1 Tax=Roseovarius litorisediminis TaxID=1312363 RepID=A0A1Y5RT44_9RHOB|nr:methyltransferase [Roseovarius litorisediminis]SLN22158.1 N5-glutamine S-adenosyl-L-methionine-dependent methyltransferase [Roseovarius litorisediminis]